MSTRAGWFLRRLVFVLPMLFAGRASVCAAETIVREAAPGVIQLTPDIQRRVEAMLERSPTFREQYQRILHTPLVIITARVEAAVLSTSFRARSTIRRYGSGLLIVLMEIAPGANQAQWIAHEFEHVVEQLDGIDVGADAAAGHRHSWYTGDRAVETLRAVRAGRQVEDEMRRAKTSSDKVVERTQ